MAGKKYIDLKENDFVEYYLFPNLSSTFSENNNKLTLIDEIKDSICKIAKIISENYIWHNDKFQIFPKNLVAYKYSEYEGEYQRLFPILTIFVFISLLSKFYIGLINFINFIIESEAFSFYGSLNYGENIEDEWFLVYILIELTKQITDLVVR